MLWHILDQNSPLAQILEKDWKVNYCKDLGKDITGNEKGERGMGNGDEGAWTRNGERGTRNEGGERGTENGKMKNSKQNQNKEPVIKLLKVHEFNFGFVPIFSITCFLCWFPSSRFWFSYHFLEKVKATEALRNRNSQFLVSNLKRKPSSCYLENSSFFPVKISLKRPDKSARSINVAMRVFT